MRVPGLASHTGFRLGVSPSNWWVPWPQGDSAPQWSSGESEVPVCNICWASSTSESDSGKCEPEASVSMCMTPGGGGKVLVCIPVSKGDFEGLSCGPQIVDGCSDPYLHPPHGWSPLGKNSKVCSGYKWIARSDFLGSLFSLGLLKSAVRLF